MSYSLGYSGDTARVLNYGFHRIVIDDSELPSVNLDTCACVRAYQNKISHLAASAGWEAFFVFEGVGAHLYNE
jgi:hypothetical protein